MADRIVLQEAIEACLDAGMGEVFFADAWASAQRLTQKSEAELQAEQAIEAAGEVEDYIVCAQTVMESQLNQTEGGDDNIIARETAAWAVNKYEREADNVDPTLDPTSDSYQPQVVS